MSFCKEVRFELENRSRISLRMRQMRGEFAQCTAGIGEFRFEFCVHDNGCHTCRSRASAVNYHIQHRVPALIKRAFETLQLSNSLQKMKK